ncbi:Arc family DNA-binding protein [Photobacterium iliopiscarium]|uniref:Arc family DNA-binding protein n=1 Tax=Photobacterium iliopiscarium TaxID=56192 RepID=UPI003C6E93DF
MPTELRAWFEKEAVTNRRSLNSELVHALEKEMKGVFIRMLVKNRSKKPQCWNTEALNALTKLQG